MPSTADTPHPPRPGEAPGTAGSSWLPWRLPWWPFTGKEDSGEPDSAEVKDRGDGAGDGDGTGQLDPPVHPVPPRSPEPSGASGPGRGAPDPGDGAVDPRERFARAQADAAAAFAEVEARAGEWDRLVMVCVDMADRLRVHDPGLFAVLRSGLDEVGVTLAEVDGESFDRKRHRAVGREPTGEPGRHMTVAHTQLCGVTDRDRQIRLPAVVVYVEAGEGSDG